MKMMLRKQTVWLLTMLAVMVVLSGYYLVKGPNDQMPALSEEQQQEEPIAGVEVESQQTDQPAPEATPVEGQNSALPNQAEGSADSADQALTVTDTTSDVFQGYKMKRDALLQQQKDEQLAIMSNSEATPQAVAEAKAKYEELSTLENATISLEELLKASGYKDAVVYVQNDKATVIVQKDKLDANEVVSIISQAKQHLNIPATNVTVQFKAS
jgi:stage III sporulation protein AH